MTGFKIKLAAFFISIVQFLASLGILPCALSPSATIDFSQTDQEIGAYASGYLYGIATYSVPSEAMVESVDISSISVKPDGGLQHPVGDFSPAADMAKNADYIIVYLQDVYDTWYYCHEQITNLRKLGEYDSLDFVQNDYIPKLREVLNSERLKEYEEKIVLCPFNEPDNAVWFGTQIEDENNENGFTRFSMTQWQRNIIPHTAKFTPLLKNISRMQKSAAAVFMTITPTKWKIS